MSDEQQLQLKQLASKAADTATKGVYDKTQAFIADAVTFVIGFVVMALALYYFFADGPKLLREAKDFSPLAHRGLCVRHAGWLAAR